MNLLKIRKIFLSAGCLIFFVVSVFQIVASKRESGKTVKTDKKIDEITVVTPSETIQLIAEADKWFVGSQKYPATLFNVEELLDGISSIKLLEKTASVNSAGAMEKYEFVEGKEITVTAKSDGKIIRTLRIGKTSTTSSQTFVIVDDGSEIYLAAGNLYSTFNESLEHLRDKTVAEFDTDLITSVSVRNSEGKLWTLSKSGDKGDYVWNISGADIDVDSEKAVAWFDSLKNLITSKWYDNPESLAGTLEANITVSEKDRKVGIDIYKISAETEEKSDIYYATCTETPYTFEMPQYLAARFLKDPESLAK